MAGYTMQQILGQNSIQDINGISLSKADLSNVGLTPADQNDGESLLAALLVQAQSLGLDTDHRDGNDDETILPNPNQQLAVNPPVTTLVNRQDTNGNTVLVRRDSYVIDFDTFLPAFNPNAY